MGGHALTPPTHRRLGGPLPHQLANGTRAPPKARGLKDPTLSRQNFTIVSYSVLPGVSTGYPQLQGRSLTRYSPVRRYTRPRKDFPARLACVKRAANVRSEPGSNSH